MCIRKSLHNGLFSPLCIHCVGVQWELSILLFCQCEVKCCVVSMSLLKAAPASHSEALCVRSAGKAFICSVFRKFLSYSVD